MAVFFIDYGQKSGFSILNTILSIFMEPSFDIKHMS